jgi:ChAPs (Chs5p-Arf1p-binding proteins)
MGVIGGCMRHECFISLLIGMEFCSCFNAFSRVDIRVDVKIPGGVNAYVIDLRGERYAESYSQRFRAYPYLQPRSYPRGLARDLPLGASPSHPLFGRFCVLGGRIPQIRSHNITRRRDPILAGL